MRGPRDRGVEEASVAGGKRMTAQFLVVGTVAMVTGRRAGPVNWRHGPARQRAHETGAARPRPSPA